MPDGAYFCGSCGALASGSGQPSPPPEPVDTDTAAEEPAPDYTSRTMSVCPRCGGNVAGDKSFCPHCGANLNERRTVLSQPEQKSNNTALIVAVSVIGVLLVAAIVVILALFMTGNKSGSNNGQTASTVTAMPMETNAPASYPTLEPAVTAAPRTASSSYSSGDYLFPSDTQYITEADLAGRSQEQVRLIINEIYARNGYIFNNQSYQAYFSSKSWYIPVSNSQQEIESRFNQYELANKNFLAQYEKDRGWR